MDWITDNLNRKPIMNISKNHQYFLSVIFLCSILYYLGDPGKIIEESIGIILVPMLVVSSYALFVRNTKFLWKNFVFAFITILLFILSNVVVGGGLGSLVNNISAVLYVLLFYNIEFTRAEYKYFARLVFVFQIFLGMYCLFYGLDDGYVGSYNSNTMGLQILLNLVYINMYLDFNRKSIVMLVNIISILLIFFVKSRTSLIAGIIVVIFILINKRKLLAAYLLKIGFWLLIFIGAYYPVLYATLYKDTENNYLQNLNLLSVLYFNKNLFTGREYIWIEAIDKIGDSTINFLFGIGSHYIVGDSNFHSSYFTIIICGGILAYIFFTWYLYRLFKKGDFATSSIQRSRLLYLAVMIIGINESTLFSGHFAVMIYMLLCTSKSFDTPGELK